MRRRTIHRCHGCGAPRYLPSLSDARWCYRCGITWRVTPIGHFRKVPPAVVARWWRA
jgi:hypothetical protein